MVKRNTKLPLLVGILLAVVFAFSAHAADNPIKTFICAGQSNMVAFRGVDRGWQGAPVSG